MINPVTGTIVVYNGEIYNHDKLRMLLENQGVAFETRSDTEVILKGYDQWGGDKLLSQIDGMFAFAVWDAPECRLFLARDRTGQKPIHYAVDNGGRFAFASTLAALHDIPWIDRSFDQEALELFFSLRFIPAPHTIYCGVRKLAPGTSLSLDRNGMQIREYWHPAKILGANFKATKRASLIEELNGLLRDAVNETLIADVPVSLLLSSGIDSAMIAKVISRLHRQTDIKCFTVGFHDHLYDESPAAGTIANSFGLKHQVLPFENSELEQQLDIFFESLDEPFGDPSIIPSMLLCQKVAEKTKVALSGDGGDELFGGYPTFQAIPLKRLTDRFPPWIHSLAQFLFNFIPVSDAPYSSRKRMEKFVEGYRLPPLLAFSRWISRFSPEESAQLLGNTGGGALERYALRECGELQNAEPVALMSILYFRLFLPGVLEKMDRASMHYSLETRAPFLQRPMIEFGINLAPEMKVRRMTSKYILRKNLHGSLPDSVVWGKKRGFNPPVDMWMRSRLGTELEEALHGKEISGHVDTSLVNRMLSDHKHGNGEYGERLWLVYVFSEFLRRRS